MKKLILLSFLLLLMPLVSANVLTEAEMLSQKILNFTDGQDNVIVIGKYASFSEKLAMNVLRDQYPQIEDVPEYTEEQVDGDPSLVENKTIFLLGGPFQNSITNTVYAEEFETDSTDLSIGKVSFVERDGKRYMVFSDKIGFNNLPRPGLYKSPFAKIMPIEYVPAAAAATGFFLLWLWKFLYALINKIFRRFLAAKIMDRVKKKELKKKYKGIKIFGIRFKVREWVSIIGSAIIWALAAAWVYISGSDNLELYLLTAIIVNSIIYSLRHIVRLFLDKKHDYHTEYLLWFWGAVVTILTGWLGNTFGLCGYTVADETKKENVKGKGGYIGFIVNLLTFIAAIIFFTWNLVAPSVLLQMCTMLALAIAFLQMLPMYPFSGKKIFAWSKFKWFVLFAPLTVLYVYVNILV